MTATTITPPAASRRDFILGGACLAGAAIAWAGTRRNTPVPLPEGELARVVPTKLGSWYEIKAGNVIAPPRSELSDETYNDVLSRVYGNDDGVRVMLLVAYGASQGRNMQLHRPELCYPAAGFAIRSVENIELRPPNSPVIAARLMNTESDDRGEQLVYWTRIGNQFPTSSFDQRMTVVRQNLRGMVPDGALVRASMLGREPQEAFPVLSAFIDDMLKYSPPAARKLLIGQK